MKLQSSQIQAHSVPWHCWLGDRKGIRPVKHWVLVCWCWHFDWSFARLIAPFVTTISISLSSNKIRNIDSLVSANTGPPGKWLLNWRDRDRDSDPAGTNMSHWWHQEQHPEKPAPVHHWIESVLPWGITVSTTLNSDISAELTATADSERETQMQTHKQRRLQTPVNYAAAAAAVSPWFIQLLTFQYFSRSVTGPI